MGFNQAVRALIKVNKDYAALIYSTLGKYIRDLDFWWNITACLVI